MTQNFPLKLLWLNAALFVALCVIIASGFLSRLLSDAATSLGNDLSRLPILVADAY